jgi:sugar/nucleoside kinase (ribokinase family)
MRDAIVIGHLLKETIIYADGGKLGPVLGSPCAYTAMGAASLGLKTGIVSKTGYDMAKYALVLQKAGIDISGIEVGEHSTENYLDYTVPEGKKLTFVHKAADINSINDIPNEYLDAKFFLLCPVDNEAKESLLEELCDNGRRTLSMELSGFGGASSMKLGTSQTRKDKLKKIVKYFKIIKGGLEDCQHIFGNVKTSDAEDICKIFIEWGAEICALTLGPEGASAYSRKEGFMQVPAPDCEVKDLTGAGDVFHAGFIAGYMERQSVMAGLESGSFASKEIIKKTGGVTLERFRELKERKPCFSEVTN